MRLEPSRYSASQDFLIVVRGSLILRYLVTESSVVVKEESSLLSIDNVNIVI